ncbi:MAG: GAF domain-containing protein [Desulfatiglans sp.]|jgi:signal transduction histidine kinase|nr:GAF domain-containing protein [Desulfatiglans sp.]
MERYPFIENFGGTSIVDVRLRLFEYMIKCSLEELLQKTLDEIELLTASSIGFYHFIDRDQKSIILQAWSTRTEKEFCHTEGKGMHYNIEQAGIWVDCVRQRKPVIHNDYPSLPGRKGLPDGHAEVIRQLVVPVIKENLIVAILGVGNKPTGYTETDVEIVSFLADVAWEIVERKRMEEALKQANDDLEKKVLERTAELEWKNHELQEFASVASHDLQEPLRKIQVFSDLVEKELSGTISEKVNDYLERMRSSAKKMQHLMKSLLAYSSLSSQNLTFEPVDLNLIADRVTEDLRPIWKETKPEIEIADLPQIEADPLQITRLFQNLITNAVRYSKKGETPVVKISGRIICKQGKGKMNEFCELSVEDNGIGFDMCHADRIFLPFERLHTHGEYEGTGMGLAICRKIVSRHGGSITVQSQPGEGSKFFICLPLKH